MPKIQNLLLKLEGFKHGTALHLNMGHCHIELSESAKRTLHHCYTMGQIQVPMSTYGAMQQPRHFPRKNE
jgi:hypothetical protein